MKYCKNCLIVDTRPNIKFTEEGLCFPCALYIKPEEIDTSVITVGAIVRLAF